MIILIILIIILGCGIIVFIVECYQSSESLTDEQQYYVGEKCIGLSPRKGYKKFEIMGIYYRNLPISIIGKFDGYATAQQDNPYDLYAIAIYNSAGTHLGFLPAGQAELHAYILAEGGMVHAYGYIAAAEYQPSYGEVCVETDKDLVTKRNKPYV